MRRQDFHYDLPPELIARHPSAQRRDSRLLLLPGAGECEDACFSDLVSLLRPDDFLVFNNSKVIPARLHGHKATGGRIEILLERALPTQQALVKIKASKAPKKDSLLILDGGQSVKVAGRHQDLFCLQFSTDPVPYFEQHGEVPLPPYLERSPEDQDKERYQTVYAEDAGSVAAPTAGLHFDAAMFNELEQAGVNHGFVTLHVGSGTYQPVRCDEIEDHQMHAEYFSLGAELVAKINETKKRGGRVVAVGTTSLRSLEAASANGMLAPFVGDTRIFIYPGYKFRTVDALLTNFHLPESTLLMLVSAIAGRERILAAYEHAIDHRYRFFSYGDCMLIERANHEC